VNVKWFGAKGDGVTYARAFAGEAILADSLNWIVSSRSLSSRPRFARARWLLAMTEM